MDKLIEKGIGSLGKKLQKDKGKIVSNIKKRAKELKNDPEFQAKMKQKREQFGPKKRYIAAPQKKSVKLNVKL